MRNIDAKKIFSSILFGIAICLPFAVLVLEFLYGTLASDSSVFRYLGWRMSLGGGHCYLDAWDNKGPVLAMLNALGYLILPIRNAGPSLVFAVLWIATAFMVRGCVMKFASPLVASLAAFMVVMSGMGVCGGVFMNCQEVIALCAASSGLLLLFSQFTRRRMYVFGMLVSMPFLAKANMIGFGIAAGILWLRDAFITRNWRMLLERIICAACGFVTILVVVTISYLPTGVKAMWDAALIYNLFERTASDLSWLEWWSRFFRDEWSLTAPGGWMLPLFAIICAASIWSLWLMRKVLERRFFFYLSTWLVIEVVFAFMAKSFYSHYLIVSFLPMAIILAYGGGRCRSIIAVSAICLTVCLFGICFRSGVKLLLRCSTGLSEIAHWAEMNIGRDRSVAVFGGHLTTEILGRAGIKSPQKYFAPLFYITFAKEARRREMRDEFVAALRNPDVEYLILESKDKEALLDVYGEYVRASLSPYKRVKQFSEIDFYKRTINP